MHEIRVIWYEDLGAKVYLSFVLGYVTSLHDNEVYAIVVRDGKLVPRNLSDLEIVE